VLSDIPLNYMFTPEGLAEVHIPLLIWRSALGGGNVDIRKTPPSQPTACRASPTSTPFRPVLLPSWAQCAANLPRLCTDLPGFDRTAFHREFDESIVRFFREHLVGDGGTR